MALFVERRVGEVDVLLVQALLGQGDGLAEPLEMDNLPLTTEYKIKFHLKKFYINFIILNNDLLNEDPSNRFLLVNTVRRKVPDNII